MHHQEEEDYPQQADGSLLFPSLGASKRRPHRTLEEEKKMEDGCGSVAATTYKKRLNTSASSTTTAATVMTPSMASPLSSAGDATTTTTTPLSSRRRRRRPRIKSHHPQYRCWILGESSLGVLVVLILLLGVWFVTNSLVVFVMHNTHSHTQAQSQSQSNQQQQQHQPPADQSSLLLWSNPKYNVVHVIQTRFMQLQPHLVHLGLARLQLFAAITVPSMIHQTEQSFLWIVRTDPDLDVSIREPLIQLLQNIPNVLLVASNDNPEGFREAHCVADIHASTVWAGRVELLQSYHAAAAAGAHTVLETRLDADDAVAVDFVDLVQANAAAVMAGAAALVSTTTTTEPLWRVWCAENHVEWQYDSPWSNTTTAAASAASTTRETGALLGLHAGRCITPGLTWQYGIGVHRSHIPLSSKHQQIQKQVRPCHEDDTDHDDKNVVYDNQCLSKLGGDLPLALRARTPTSAGMDHVLVANHTEQAFPMQQLQHSKWKESQDVLWKSLPLLFGVQAQDLWNVRAYIHDHLVDIARDALQGQCTKGHSCKQQSQDVLHQLLVGAGDNEESPLLLQQQIK